MRWTVRLRYMNSRKALMVFFLSEEAPDPDEAAARGRRNIARMFRHTSEDDWVVTQILPAKKYHGEKSD